MDDDDLWFLNVRIRGLARAAAGYHAPGEKSLFVLTCTLYNNIRTVPDIWPNVREELGILFWTTEGLGITML